MVTPGVLKENGGFGFLEIGVLMVFLSAFLYSIRLFLLLSSAVFDEALIGSLFIFDLDKIYRSFKKTKTI